MGTVDQSDLLRRHPHYPGGAALAGHYSNPHHPQAPTGCFQYYFDTVGTIQSYNYAGGQYYTDQVRLSLPACTDL